jgi:hypothetical protein
MRSRAGAPELGQAAQTGLRHRHRTLPELRRQLEDHRRPFDALRTGIEDPPVIVKILAHLGLPSRAPPRSPCAAIRSIPDNLRSPKPVANASRRRDPAHFARLRPLRRPSRPKQHRDFHQTERRLTSHRSGDIARARKKGGLKFLYRTQITKSLIPPLSAAHAPDEEEAALFDDAHAATVEVHDPREEVKDIGSSRPVDGRQLHI